jgi:hypothetical protein
MLNSLITAILPGFDGSQEGLQMSFFSGRRDTRLLTGNRTKSSFPLRYVQAADA